MSDIRKLTPEQVIAAYAAFDEEQRRRWQTADKNALVTLLLSNGKKQTMKVKEYRNFHWEQSE